MKLFVTLTIDVNNGNGKVSRHSVSLDTVPVLLRESVIAMTGILKTEITNGTDEDNREHSGLQKHGSQHS